MVATDLAALVDQARAGRARAIGRLVMPAVSRAMAKDPQERFARMSEFAAAIETGFVSASTPAGSVSTASVVVLPFENLSADPENAFFADGLTDEIISDLSKMRAHYPSWNISKSLDDIFREIHQSWLERSANAAAASAGT